MMVHGREGGTGTERVLLVVGGFYVAVGGCKILICARLCGNGVLVIVVLCLINEELNGLHLLLI